MYLAPCRDCPRRHIACHDSCKDYLDWVENNKRAKEWANKDRDIDNFLAEQTKRRKKYPHRNKRV
jgi:hypothetical protein